ncbi:MAG: thiol:disulfide interchange protein DsbA/DsbL [Amphritea sp.]
MMLKKLGLSMLLMCVPFLLNAAESQQYKSGEHFIELQFPVATADPSKVEVVEAFGYLCPHCANFEPILHHWSQKQAGKINFVRLPVVFSRSWEPLARAYYSADLLNVTDKTHQPTFDALHKERRRFRSAGDLADFYADLGVDGAKFEKMYDSFAVNMRLNQGASKLKGYGVQSVPTLIVNGKYRVTAETAGGHAGMLKVVEFLIKKEQEAQ